MKPKRQYKPGTIDDCQTPAYALKPLLYYLYEVSLLINRKVVVWECASGEGILLDAISVAGFRCFGTDIKDGYDFFTYQPEDWEVIVTNPPFSLKIPWIERCYELGKPWALLLPVETIGTKHAQELFTAHEPEIGIIYMDKRINFKMPNKGWDGAGAQFPTAWYTWKFGFSGNLFYKFGKNYAHSY